MVRPRVCRCLALCQLAALLREAHLLKAVCFALKVKFGVGTRAWTNVILVAALICLVVQRHSHSVLHSLVEVLLCHAVTFLCGHWPLICVQLNSVVVGRAWFTILD